jgi:hypothetical protein
VRPRNGVKSMTDPFQLRSKKSRWKDHSDYDEAEGPGDVRLKCRDCDGTLRRQKIPPFAWVHEDDTSTFNLTASLIKQTSSSDYDHEPALDVIEVEPVTVD